MDIIPLTGGMIMLALYSVPGKTACTMSSIGNLEKSTIYA